MIPLDRVERDEIDRKGLIAKASSGDKEAAFELARWYDQKQVPEAAYHWFGVAAKLGKSDVTPKFLDYYKTGIPCIEMLDEGASRQGK